MIFLSQNVLVIHQDQKLMSVMRMVDVMNAGLDSMEQNVTCVQCIILGFQIVKVSLNLLSFIH